MCNNKQTNPEKINKCATIDPNKSRKNTTPKDNRAHHIDTHRHRQTDRRARTHTGTLALTHAH
eukprot:m.142858 g.142858  ORF g.142858 m.142858 type:complete len:63 (+) comp30276_c0_seq2:27-215(+)